MVKRGASIWVVPGSSGLACPVAAAAGSPTNSTRLTFRFPRALWLDAFLVLPRPSAVLSYDAQCAALSLNVIDETSQPLITDSRGSLLGSNKVPVAAPLLMLHGKNRSPFKVQRPLASGDQWLFTIQNSDAANAATLAGIFLYFSEPHA